MNEKNSENKPIPYIHVARDIVVSLFAIIILIWAFPKNKFLGKIIILPFLVCSFAKLGESIFLLLHKEKIHIIFQYIFRISFFVYVFGFLIYADYYSIVNKNQLIIFTIPFWLFAICFFKLAFFRKNKQ